MAEKHERHMNHHVSHRRGIAIYVGTIVAAILVFSIGAAYGAHLRDRMAASSGPKPVALSAADQADTTLADASKAYASGNIDQAVALLTPYAKDATRSQANRVIATSMLASYAMRKNDLASAITWYNYQNTVAGSPQATALAGAGSASLQLYFSKTSGAKTRPDAATEQLKQDAIDDMTKALTLTQDATLKSQLNQQLALAKKLP